MSITISPPAVSTRHPHHISPTSVGGHIVHGETSKRIVETEAYSIPSRTSSVILNSSSLVTHYSVKIK